MTPFVMYDRWPLSRRPRPPLEIPDSSDLVERLERLALSPQAIAADIVNGVFADYWSAPGRRRDSWVYFISTDEPDAPVKVGFTANVEKRLAGLQSGHHAELKVLVAVDGDRSHESELHGYFAASRLRGEWFRRDPLIEAVILRLQRERRRCRRISATPLRVVK